MSWVVSKIYHKDHFVAISTAQIRFCCLDLFRIPGGRLHIKMPTYQYRDSHAKDKTVSLTALPVTWESPYLGKTALYWDGALLLHWGSVSGVSHIRHNLQRFPWCPLTSFRFWPDDAIIVVGTGGLNTKYVRVKCNIWITFWERLQWLCDLGYKK